jgi:hypothetical protein
LHHKSILSNMVRKIKKEKGKKAPIARALVYVIAI